MPDRLLVEETDGQVRVRWHEEGQIRAEAPGDPEPFTAPLSAEELEDLRWYLEEYLRAPYAVWEDRGREIQERLPEWGERLFGALFGPGEAGRDAYLRGRDHDDWELWFASSSPEFLSLPWELMRDPDRGTPLALDLAGVHRTIEAPGAAFSAASGETLRVLMVIARPYGEKDVPYRTVARPLLKRLEPVAGKVELEVLRPPTFERMEEVLRGAQEEGRPFQILHFDGHGSFRGSGAGPAQRQNPGGRPDPDRYAAGRAEGVLLFETDAGEEAEIGAGDLGPVLKDAKVPLLVLNACQSGMVGGESPEAAVATRLLRSGAAAVVAMGYTVYAVAAAEFMAAFYERLFRGEPVTRAVTAGRRRLHRRNERPSPKGPLPLEDWVVPVHYARREVAYPELQRRPREGLPGLDRALDQHRQQDLAAAAGEDAEGVHQEGDVAPAEGRFFGRDREFQWLETALRTRHVVLLRGIGGVGKTELAKAFGRWLSRSGGLEHPDLVFFHSFEPGVASFGLDGVVSSVGLRLFGADFARLDSARRVEAVLGALRQARILLIWDNFESVRSMPAPGQATPPLDEAERRRVVGFLDRVRREGKGGVIVTSRSPEDWLGKEIPRLRVEGLGPEDQNEYAEALLKPYPKAKERRGTKAYGKLLQFLGGHPFSLRLILPRLAEEPPEAILQELRGEEAEPYLDLAALDEALETEGRTASRDASVHYSLRHLPDEDRERLPALTLFEGVADGNVLGIVSQQESAPERFRGIDRDGWLALARRCVEIGLLTELGAGMFRIHPALPRYLAALWRRQAGEDLEGEREAALRASLTAHAALGRWLNQQIEGGDAATAFAVLALERRTLGAVVEAALERGLFDEAQAVLQPLTALWDARGEGLEARAWVDRCKEALETVPGEPPDLETPAGALWLFVVSSEARRTLKRGRLAEAEAEYDAIRRALEGGEDETSRRRLGVVYHQLGRVVEDRGDLSSAEGWYRQSLEFKESLGDRPGMAPSYHQLGIVAQKRGDLSSAGSWHRQSLEIRESLGDRPGMAESYHQLGMVAQLGGDLSSAEGWYRRALEIKESLGDRPGMARSYHQLGMVAELGGDLSSAEGWYRRSLEIKESLGDRPGMARSYHQLGMVAELGGDLSSAEGWYRRSLEILESLGDRPGMARSYHQLGMVAQARGDLSSAEGWYRRSLEIAESLENRPGMALTYAALGLLAEVRGRKEEALEWTVRCVALFAEFPHPSTGPGPDHLARLTGELGMEALETAWKRVTGRELPANVRSWVEDRL